MTIDLPDLHQVTGHAGRWVLEGPAHVLTDDQVFEHPTLVVLHQLVDPERVIVAEIADVQPFTPIADDPGQPIAV